MIPKTIHYCWFGHTQKSDDILRCIQSWKEKCPDFVIKEWNESNVNIEANPFTKKMYHLKRWAFVADYVRLQVLEQEGGFYLDADMLLLKSLSPFCDNSCVLGEESDGIISAGMVAVEPMHPYIKKCKEFYDNEQSELITIPLVLTALYKEYPDKENILVLPPRTFYPFDAEHIKKYHGQDLGESVYGVHLWNYSWGHPLNKFFKKIRVYSFGRKVVELLGIKKILKKIFRFI